MFHCDECDHEPFPTQQGLKMHRFHRHNPSKQKRKYTKKAHPDPENHKNSGILVSQKQESNGTPGVRFCPQCGCHLGKLQEAMYA